MAFFLIEEAKKLREMICKNLIFFIKVIWQKVILYVIVSNNKILTQIGYENMTVAV